MSACRPASEREKGAGACRSLPNSTRNKRSVAAFWRRWWLPFGAGGGSRIAGHMGRALRSRMGRALRSRMGRALRSRTLQSEDRCLRRVFFPRHAVPAQVAGSCIAGRDRCLRRSFSTQHGQSQGSRRIVRSRAWQVGQVRGLRRSFSHPTRQSDRSGAGGAPFPPNTALRQVRGLRRSLFPPNTANRRSQGERRSCQVADRAGVRARAFKRPTSCRETTRNHPPNPHF